MTAACVIYAIVNLNGSVFYIDLAASVCNLLDHGADFVMHVMAGHALLLES